MNDTLAAQMIEYYRQRAPIYDESMGYTNARRWREHAELVEFLRERLAGRDVLEIACGAGRWTQAIASVVRSLVATDANDAMLAEARNKRYGAARVRFAQADAYSLRHISGSFTAGFAVDWWSHMPKSRVRAFVDGLHDRLLPGSSVVFIDQLPREALDRMFLRYDSGGDLIQARRLPSGNSFEVIKNFPSQDELFSLLHGAAVDLEYFIHEPTRRWVLAYRVERVDPEDDRSVHRAAGR
ncbi:MAG: class I SAM-dependent methyltransferase [Gammaproteobacteria bacterium]|jgi:SAM-dependent methyltransferase